MRDEHKFYLYSILLKTAPAPGCEDLHMDSLVSLMAQLWSTEYREAIYELNRVYLGWPEMKVIGSEYIAAQAE